MSDPPPDVFAGARDTQDGNLSLADRFRRHADALERSHRSPLCVEIMRGAAQDIDAGGITAGLFRDVPVPPGSVPALRLLAALHDLVLRGRAAALASFYPTAGGDRPPGGVWPVALATIEVHAGEVGRLLRRTVQTNDPGRACVLYAALLWLSERHRLPIRLFELGASAGLNLHADRFAYVVDGVLLGDPRSPVRFVEPWRRAPPIELTAAAGRLRIAERGGCDLAPLDPADAGDRLTLLSYIWPDEPERLARTRAAIDLAARDPVRVTAQPAGEWLVDRLATASEDTLTVIWHSLFVQYLGEGEWAALQECFETAGRTVVWLSMEPRHDSIREMQLTVRCARDSAERRLARCGDHGPPLSWDD